MKIVVSIELTKRWEKLFVVEARDDDEAKELAESYYESIGCDEDLFGFEDPPITEASADVCNADIYNLDTLPVLPVSGH